MSHEAYYAQPGAGRYISVTAAGDEGAAWEFEIHEADVNGVTTRVEVYADSYAAFTQAPELFAALGARSPGSLDEARKVLDQAGAVDETERKAPVT